jgi:predicted RNase H-like HicB family nuclease
MNEGLGMKTYVFKVAIEQDKWPDEPDEKAIWRAYVPALPSAHAWGDTHQQALENLRNAVELIIEELHERDEEIPMEAVERVSDEPLLTVNV